MIKTFARPVDESLSPRGWGGHSEIHVQFIAGDTIYRILGAEAIYRFCHLTAVCVILGLTDETSAVSAAAIAQGRVKSHPLEKIRIKTLCRFTGNFKFLLMRDESE